jgi:hypothetical protein
MMKIMIAISLMVIGSLAYGDSANECSDNLATETLCSQTASALRIQLHALELLRKYPQDDNHAVIGYLEGQSKGYETTLQLYANKPECQTKNVATVLTDYQRYSSSYETTPKQK